MLKDNYDVVSYFVIDDFRCMHPLSEVDLYPDVVYSSSDEYMTDDIFKSELHNLFLSAGWEGDGEIQCIFIPPCFIFGVEDGCCRIIFHVKQKNNGISWLAIPKWMDFVRPDNYF